MNPYFALLACFVFVITILYLDRTQKSESVSSATWLPVMWLMILGSRNVGIWSAQLMSLQTSITLEDSFHSGNPIDRVVLTTFIVVGLAVLSKRETTVLSVLRQNKYVVLFILLSAISLAWSDYPYITFRKWMKCFGSIIMILVVLTEKNVDEAAVLVIRRCAFVLIPFSIVLIKYFPSLGMTYSPYTGAREFIGVTTSKNMLGRLCLIAAPALLFSLLHLRGTVRDSSHKKTRGVNIACLAMTAWLLIRSHSTTSMVCLGVAVLILLIGVFPAARGSAKLVNSVILLLGGGVLCGFFFFDLALPVADVLGRRSTFAGRMDLWKEVLSVGTNPIIGVGYDSFWLGERLEVLWKEHWWRPNQAHNGYIEVYLTLGIAGLLILTLAMKQGYQNMLRTFATKPELASLMLAYLISILVMNVAESSFRPYDFAGFVLFLVMMARVTGATNSQEGRHYAENTGFRE